MKSFLKYRVLFRSFLSGISFLFTDSQVKDERFLVYLNDLLSSGNIPDLFDAEGVDQITGSMTSAVKAAGEFCCVVCLFFCVVLYP